MKNIIAVPFLMLGAGLIAAANYKPSSPLPPHPSSKAISEPTIAAALGDASAADASTMPAATAEQHDADFATAVVSLPLTETSEDFQQATAKQEQQEGAMVQACNQVRARFGVAPCRESAALTAAAQGHANVLAARGYNVRSPLGYAHDGYGDGNPLTRAAAAGFTGTILTPPDAWGNSTRGEVVGPSTSPDYTGRYGVFQGWLDSAGHRVSLLCPTFDSCGFGVAQNQYGYVFVGVFGDSRTPRAQFISAAPAATAIPAARSAVSYTQPRAFSTCGPNGCGQSFYPQRQYIQQPQQWQYQRPGLFGWRR